MEWYCGSRVNDVVVPRDQGAWSRFPLQERWKQCGLDAWESFDSNDKSLALRNIFTDEADFTCETLMDEMEMVCMVVDGEQEEISGVRGGISESSNCWTTLLNNQDYRLDGFTRTNQTDENFVNSLLVDDVRVSEQFHSYGSPDAHGTYSSANDLTDDVLLNLDVFGSYEQMNAQDFPYSLDWEKKQSDTPHHNLSNMMNTVVPQCNTPTGNVEAPPRQLCASRRVGDQPSVEETVLQELGSAMQQMTDESRLCFRDAFYRLASNAGKHLGIQGQNGDKLASEKPFTTALLDQALRDGKLWKPCVNVIDKVKAGGINCYLTRR
uniref:Uncharacterized protein n=1 Tax=Kalanchoe fedtschenkoi TaxID=63787 RepID=A0A7N0UCG0_KALFE